MAEFTGERLIPGQVDADLLNEHMARYAFAARLAQGKRVLDAGCGAGYGAAELAKKARFVAGVDAATEAVTFARAHYTVANLEFAQASCEALPHPDGCFDLVVSFEVIEHMENYRAFLREVRRVLAPGGEFIVSTPNRLYYTESRGAEGANPFHFHEFEFEEFQRELAEVFPSVAMFVENHIAGLGFQSQEPDSSVELRVEEGDAAPAEASFLLAVCALRSQIGSPTFIYVPRTANVLRERERHIGLLERDLAKMTRELAEFGAKYRKLTEDLERSNRWAEGLDHEIKERRARVVQLQEELAEGQAGYEAKIAEQGKDLAEAREGYEAKIAELDEELAKRAAWAHSLEEKLQLSEAELERIRSTWWYRMLRKAGVA